MACSAQRRVFSIKLIFPLPWFLKSSDIMRIERIQYGIALSNKTKKEAMRISYSVSFHFRMQVIQLIDMDMKWLILISFHNGKQIL